MEGYRGEGICVKTGGIRDILILYVTAELDRGIKFPRVEFYNWIGELPFQNQETRVQEIYAGLIPYNFCELLNAVK